MTEFLKNYVLISLNYIPLLTVFFGLLFYKKFKLKLVKLFLILFTYSYLNDLLGYFLKYNVKVSSNLILYNIQYIFNFIFLFWLYHSIIKSNIFKKLIFLFFILYLLSSFYEVLFLKRDYFNEFQTIPYIIGGVCILITVLFYFFEVFNSDEIIIIDKKIVFWISIAYFFYYLALVPLKVQQNFYAITSDYKYLLNIRIIATFLMNLFLIIGFIWSKEEVN